jgi:hypothetical protein
MRECKTLEAQYCLLFFDIKLLEGRLEESSRERKKQFRKRDAYDAICTIADYLRGVPQHVREDLERYIGIKGLVEKIEKLL